ncbi:GNAT family N-acetyltransferase [Oceanirhabdus sp. W0125-5]|uniref:GNAT family N-acetyltransferase n=1 Tax=Oceanirhabdus sp. W0125-5 TaxID=2999116 RepID=UPI0022F2E783|nr:GNAT family N-acetyltransferase [Oceanirhabdus sp. W0125-5]WBW96974.1 GNAT family N-acetyltransferase [Oceanirhabdus sp. W0125-5]
MIKILNQDYEKKILDYVTDEKEYNLFIISNIENQGFEEEYLTYYGDIDEEDNIKGIMVKFFNIYTIYTKSECWDIEGFVDVLNNSELGMITGKERFIQELSKAGLQIQEYEGHYFATMRKKKTQELNGKINSELDKLEKITCDMIEEVVQLRESIPEFMQGSGNFGKILRKGISNRTARAYCIRENGKMVAFAQTSAENSQSAMITSVMTHLDYRKKGYASLCVEKLCDELIQEDRRLCLYYVNQNAGKIYRKIGFKEIGKWGIGRFRGNNKFSKE